MLKAEGDLKSNSANDWSPQRVTWNIDLKYFYFQFSVVIFSTVQIRLPSHCFRIDNSPSYKNLSNEQKL